MRFTTTLVMFLSTTTVKGVFYMKEVKETMYGEQLKFERELYGLSVRDFEKITGIGYSYVSKYENHHMEPYEKHLDIIEDFINGEYDERIYSYLEQKGGKMA
ncbi:hypothetical protein COL70_28900 [Bacillus pseudomycoides]|nr:hypothetical protein COL70_28900 [Bacillus pseudomycoides]